MNILKKTIVLTVCLIGLTGTPLAQADLGTTLNVLGEAWGKIGSKVGTALVVHYAGQSITNLLYTTHPDVKEEPFLQLPLSVCQTLISCTIADEVYNRDYVKDTRVEHLIGWAVATALPKPATLVKNTINYFRAENTSTEIDSTTEEN